MSDNTDGAIVGLIPAATDPITAASSEPAHMTMVWFGSAADLSPEDIAALRAEVVEYAASASGSIHAEVESRGTLGEDEADVVFLEGEGIRAYRDGLAALPMVSELAGRVEQHPEWLPHVTLGYPDTPANEDYSGESVEFDRLSLWVGGEQEHFPLGGETESDMDEEVEASEGVQWHGVLAPVGVMSGDGRIFDPGAITFRDFPLPFKAMRKDLPGHDESVVVGNITNAWEENGLVKGEGTFASNEDAEYFIQLRKDDAMRGVSVDLDMAESQTENAAGEKVDIWNDPFDPEMKYVERVTQGRVASATICAIPAFQEAYFDLGPWPEVVEPVEVAPEQAPPIAAAGGWGAPASITAETFVSEKPWDGSASRFTDEQWKASCVVDRGEEHDTAKTRYAVPIKEPEGELSRAGVHAAAGRINQVDAPSTAIASGKRKLRGAYSELGEEPPESITASAAWIQSETMSPAYTLVDIPKSLTAAASPAPPKEWFENPNLEALTPLTITDDGRVFGHAAGWGVCHIGLDKCVMAPKSPSQYAYFHTGALETDGGLISVGQITMATGHASLSLGARPAVEHYDNTGTVVADIRAGEDKFGIWMAGQLRPGLSDAQLREFRAAGVSGDWREIGGQSEFVAALAVNVGGFPIPRLGFAASGSRMTALVAAAVVLQDEREHDQEDAIKEIVKAAVREVREEDKRVARASEIRAELDKDNPERRAKVLAAIGEEA